MNFRKVLPLVFLALAFLLPDAAALNGARHSQAAVLLPNGDFMVTGGVSADPNTPTTSVEIYFTSAAAWGSGGNLATARSSHTATLMSDGRVLVAGGFSGGAPLQSAEVYNTSSHLWTNLGGIMTSARGAHTATLLSKGSNAGKVLICGGQTNADPTAADGITNSCELFNPLLDTFSGAIPPMTSPRMGHTASLLSNGNVFASGGLAYNSGFVYLPTNELFVPEANAWRPGAGLLEGRIRHTSTVLNNGNVLIAGGFNGLDQDDQFSHDFKASQVAQNQGTKGYLESVEMFDPYGARVPLSGSDYDVMPYRNSSQAAVLSPDSQLHLTGGYGNIPVSYIPGSANVPEGHSINLSLIPSGTYGVATITGGSMELQMQVPLSRKVSGRIVNGNIYFSLPKDPKDPSLKIGGAAFFLGRTTATLDAFPIRKSLSTGDGGLLKDIINLPAPTLGSGGTVVYPDFTATASGAHISVSALDFASPLAMGDNADLLATSGMTLNNLKMNVPDIYEGALMTCFAYITGGQVIDSKGRYSVNFSTAISNFITGTVSGGKVTANNVVFTQVGGVISNTTDYNLITGLNAAPNLAQSLALNLECTGDSASIIATKDTVISLSADVSTVVIREMIFSDDLGYDPAKSSWDFDKNVTIDFDGEGSISTPKFDHSSILTPAADRLDIGGRNCEASTNTYCLRGLRRFDPIKSGTVHIFQNTLWADGPALNDKRAAHTSTLLPDGSILTCGGSDGARTLTSCERLLDGKWVYTGDMISPRAAHTATLLPNGNVLMTGGTTGASTASINTAEIYYPDTQRFVLTSPMSEARMNHTATLLPDGDVLLVAGSSGTAYSNTSEIYITTAAKWQTVTDLMGTARAQHTATLLKSGQVMVTGGIAAFGAVNTVEIYDPLTRQWNPAPANLIMGRYAHSANLLKDNRVLVTGGTNGLQVLKTAEIFDGTGWVYTANFPGAGLGNDMLTGRANHTSTLLPNGEILVSGGEGPSVARGFSEGFDVDFSTWQSQGTMQKRTSHTTVLTANGDLINIGGYTGSKYLNTTDVIHFTFNADARGLTAAVQRQPTISTGTLFFDTGGRVTLTSDATNFHGISEASGGGGPGNSSFSNPRVYIQQIDNPSGFLTDLTTSLYTLYGSPNTNWETTLSSITIITPSNPGEMPHGWYQMHVAANGQFSDGFMVQVTIPRPTGTPSAPLGNVMGTSSITWNWNQGTVGAADGYNLYASSNSLFITTAAFISPAAYTQTSLSPNTAASVKVGAYNLCGVGPLAESATYYTLASSPTALTITMASFETAALTWGTNGNALGTTYELSLAVDSSFADPLTISTPVPFSVNFISTFTEVNQLSPNHMYYFRVRAINGSGITTPFSNIASTITVASVNNLTGTALSSASIRWSWDPSEGADFYEIYDIAMSTTAPPFISSTTYNYTTQSQGLAANLPYKVGVNAVKNDPVNGPVKGPRADSVQVYTLTIPPLPGVPNAFSDVSTGSFTANWIANGNSTSTIYNVQISSFSLFTKFTEFTTKPGYNKINFAGLKANDCYFVHTNAVNGDGIVSATVDLGEKCTRARVPANVTPSTISMSGVTLTWDANDNSNLTIYEVRGSTDNFSLAITTYVPFSDLYTSTSVSINGLLTATSYYFDVAARNYDPTAPNGLGYETSRIPAVPLAYTLAGAGGAPPGSIGGTSDPSKLVTIHGFLPDNREVTLSIPPGSFAKATGIAISSSITNDCGNYHVAGQTVEIAIYSEDGAQPQEPVALTLTVKPEDFVTIPGVDLPQLVIARYNTKSGLCLPLDTKINSGPGTITATLNHFSVFQLMLRTAATDLSEVKVYPNPLYTNRGNGYITIDRMPAYAKVRIYTLSGIKIWEGTAGPYGMVIWKGLNSSGKLAASGVYLAVIDSSAGKKVLKLAVER